MKFKNHTIPLVIILGLSLSLSLPSYAEKQDPNKTGKQSDTVPNPYAKPSSNKLMKPSATTIKPPSNYIALPKPVFKPGPVKYTKYQGLPLSLPLNGTNIFLESI